MKPHCPESYARPSPCQADDAPPRRRFFRKVAKRPEQARGSSRRTNQRARRLAKQRSWAGAALKSLQIGIVGFATFELFWASGVEFRRGLQRAVRSSRFKIISTWGAAGCNDRCPGPHCLSDSAPDCVYLFINLYISIFLYFLSIYRL